MSRSLSSQVSTGLRRALRGASEVGAFTRAPLDAKVMRPRRWASLMAAVAVVVTLGTQPAQAFTAAHAGSAGSPVTPQQLSRALSNLKHQVGASATETGGAGTGKKHQPGKGELPAAPGPAGHGPSRESGPGLAAQTGAHTQPPGDLRDRQLAAAAKPQGASAKAAPDATGSAGIPGAAPAGSELPSLRTATTSVFQNADGTRTMRVYSRPVHFRKSDGSWGNIDTRLVQDAAGRWTARADDQGSSFANTAADPAVVSWSLDAGHQVSYSLQGASAVAPKVSGNTVTYLGARQSADVVYDALATSIKETLVLHDATAPTVWTFPLQTVGLTAAPDKGGDVVFTDSAGKVDLVIPRGFMRDAGHHGDGAVSGGVTYRLTTTAGGQQALQVSLDASWLHDPKRVFPVRVDPTTTGTTQGQTTTSTYVETPYNQNFSSDVSIKVGTYDSGTHQATGYLKFPSIGSSSLQNQYIEKVTLNVDAVDGSQCSTATEVNVREITESWNPSTVTLASQVALGANLGNDTFKESNQNGCTSGAVWIPFDLGDNASAAGTKLVENWVHGGSNYGVALTASLSDTNAWKVFNSASSSYPPYLSVTYSAYGADYSTPTSYIPPTSSSTGSQSVTLTNRGTSSWTSTNMKLKARLYDASWNEISTSAPLTAVPSTVAPNGSVTMTGTIPAIAPGKSYQLCWDLYVNGTTSLQTSYGVPFQNCTWVASANIPPQIDAMQPLSNTTVGSLMPELHADAHDPDNYPGTGLTYDFQLLGPTGSVTASSGWVSTTSWVVPRGTLAWNATYSWDVAVSDSKNASAWSNPASLTTQVQQPLLTSQLAQGSGSGRPFDPQVGNYTTAATDANVKVTGPSLAVTRSYNSLDPRTTGLFGAGWSSSYDMQLQLDGDSSGGVQVTGQDGRVQRFGRNDYALANVAGVGDLSGGTSDDIVAVDDAAGDLYAYSGPSFSAATRVGLSHGWSGGPNGNWASLTWLTGFKFPTNPTGNLIGSEMGDLVGVDPSTGKLWEWGNTCPQVVRSTYGVGTSFGAGLPFQCDPTDVTDGTDWRTMSQLTITPPLSGDGKLDLVAVQTSTGYLFAYPINTDGTLGTRVQIGSGWTGGYTQLTGGNFTGSTAGTGSLIAISPSGGLYLYPGTGTGSLGTSVLGANRLLSTGWSQAYGLSRVNGIPGDSSSDFIATDGATGAQYLYHSATSYTVASRTVTGMNLYTSPSGESEQLFRQSDGSWVLRERGGTVYTFAQQASGSSTWQLSKITDKHGRTQTLAYNIDGTLATVTDTASSRALHFAWNSTKTHVTQVTTDPVTAGNTSTALTWTYTYNTSAPDELDTVCAPPTGTNTQNACTTYNYTSGSSSGSHFTSTVQDSAPVQYWSLNDVVSDKLVDESMLHSGMDWAGVRGVTGETPSPSLLPGSPTKVAGFSGVSSEITLPDQVAKNSYVSVAMWFKTSTPDGVLFSYQADDTVTAGTTSHPYTPALYVGHDGKLQGLFSGTASTAPMPMSSSAAVTDNKWHYVVLTAAGNAQQLWLDGSLAGSTTWQVQPIAEPHTDIGAGFIGGVWPDEVDQGKSGNTGYVMRFTGDIAQVSLYQRALGAAAIAQQWQASQHAATELTSIVLPSGKTKFSATYDAVHDRASQITDANGGTWKLNPTSISGSTDNYRGAVLGSNPSGYWRLSDSSGIQADNQIYANRTTPDNGTYSNVSLAAPGPFNYVDGQGTTRSAPAAGFDGATSWTELPAANVPTQGPGTIGLWFKTTSAGVLYSYQSFAVGQAHTAGTDHWNPALYVGTDGKLHGMLYIPGQATTLTSTATVTDGNWHYAALAATSTNSQTLYLDGTSQGTLAGTITPNGTAHVYVGAGTADGWQAAPSDPDGHFNGTIADVAVYPQGLTASQITTLAAKPTNTSTPQNLYDTAVLNYHPQAYWRLNDTSGNTAGELVSSTLAQQNHGTYTNTTCCATGPWASGTSTATGFNGTSSSVQLPGTVQPTAAPYSVELWFKTSSPGVIYSYQSFPLGAAHTSGTNQWDPALYVGSDNKLHGEFFNGALAPAVSATTVTDGAWHQAALVASGTSQQLYLDGRPSGSPITGTVQYNGQGDVYLGAGTVDGSWPNPPTDTSGHLNGSIADFASYSYAVDASTIAADYQSATTATGGTGMTADEAYRTRIVQDGATDYWRLNDPSGSSYAQDELGTSLPDPYAGTYSNTTLNTAGPSGNPDEAAATFNGTSSSLQLPSTAAPTTGPASIELWFKTSTAGVLYSYQSNPLGSATTNWNPALYVGTDGKLHGLFGDGNGSADQLTSSSTVTDGKWHQAVLAATTSSQTLYLDGAQAATESKGTLQYNGYPYVYLGAGTSNPSFWPAAPTADGTSTNYFNGSIAEAAYYPATLSATTVQAHYTAMGNSANPTPVTTATVTDPGGNTLTYRYDSNNGGRALSTTNAYGDTTSYGYDTNGNLYTVTDADGHTTTYGHDADGNTVSTTTCRTAGNCQTSYATYFINSVNALDPRNDQIVSSSDARSADATDSTYETSYRYDTIGDLVNTNLPSMTGSFNTTNTYTAGTETAVGGGTEPPGLPATTSDYDNNKTSYAYKSNGDLDHTVSPSGLTTSYTYDNLGRIASQTVTCTDCSTGAQTTTTSYTLDGHGNLLTETDPTTTDAVNGAITHTRVTTNTYDNDGNHTGQTVSDATGDDKARTTTWVYANPTNDLVTSTTDPAGHTTSYGYDGYGNRTSMTDPAGTNYSYSYSPMGQLQQTAITNYTGNPDSPVSARLQIIDSRAYDPAGRLATDTDAMGRTTHTYYFNDNKVSEVDLDAFHDFSPQTKTFTGTTRTVVEESDTYDAAGNQIQQTTGGGKTTVTSTYDDGSRLTSSTLDPAGLDRTTSYTYDNDNHVLSTKTTGGGQTRETDNTYDALGDTLKTTVVNTPANSVTTSSYDQAGQVVSSVSPNGNASGATPADFTTSYTYDAAGRPTQVIAPPVSTTTFNTSTGQPTTASTSAITATGYDTFGETAETKDADGNITTYTHTIDSTGMHLSVAANSYTAPGASTAVTPVVQTDYDALGHPLRTTLDPTGLDRVSTSTYDQLGNNVETDEPAVNGTAPVTRNTYDLDGEILSTTDPTGAVAQSTYDDLGRRITATQLIRQTSHTSTGGAASVHTSAYGYDDAGDRTTTVAPNGETGTTTFDAAQEVVSATDPLQRTSTFGYDLVGDQVKATEPGTDSSHTGSSTVTTFDQAGNTATAAVTDPTGKTVSSVATGYDADGNPTSVATTADDGTTSATTASYNAADQIVQQVQPTTASHSITTRYTYDPDGNATAYTDGNLNTTYTTYNTLGLPESVIDPATTAYPSLADRTYTTAYDTAGETTAIDEPGGVTQTATYDADGNLLTQAGTGAESATAARSYGYDQDGRVTNLSTPTGNETYAYDDSGQLWASSGPAGNATYLYDTNGQVSSRTDKTGTTNFTYDNAGQLATLADPVTGTTLTYGYYGNGDLKSTTYGTGGPTQNYTYNALHQVTQNTLATGSGTTIASQAYGYYPSGRVKSQTTTGLAGPSSNTYTYDQGGRLNSWNNGTTTANYAYDDNGNLTQRGSTTATYNQRNQLQSAGSTSYNYTARGTLASTTVGGTATMTSSYNAFDQLTNQGAQNYTYDAAGRLLTAGTDSLTYDDTSDAVSSDGTEDYTRSSTDQLTSIGNGTSAAFAYNDPHGDLLGTFTGTGTALAGSASYDPWGQPTATAGTGHDLGYQGGWTDPSTGQVNTASRWYNPATADFTSRDAAPLNPTTSANGNLYAYADDNPVSNADPSGNSPCANGSSPGYGPGGSGSPSGAMHYPSYDYDHNYAWNGNDSSTSWMYNTDYNYNSWMYSGYQYGSSSYGFDFGFDFYGDFTEGLEGFGDFFGEAAVGALQSDFGLTASASSCRTRTILPPPPIDWHKQKPRVCASSADHCVTTLQNGDGNGPEASRTHNAQAGVNGSTQQDPFAVSAIDPTTGLPTGISDPESSCLTGSPTGPNIIDYWATDPQRGNRATGADACLTRIASGTTAQTSIPGYQWAKNYVTNDLGVNSSKNINACHLIPQQVGGRGVKANLATCGRATNAAQAIATWSPMTVAEEKLVAALGISGGQVVYYQAIPLYRGSRTVPTGFMLYGFGSVSGVIVDETVGNSVYDSAGYPHNIGASTASNGSIPQ
ncbi:LamG-like jellyroll fold domain-containing protein [Streptacidiphilus sp. N1-12]|uniref:LamG-like jellyroll fold domain-containing protein n=2 Tax=Streptacidiphilus alkalitolerans TaxID=3342712 RepID=A0ABV6VH44_9ACTN